MAIQDSTTIPKQEYNKTYYNAMYNTRLYNSTQCIDKRGRATCIAHAGQDLTKRAQVCKPAFCTFAGIS